MNALSRFLGRSRDMLAWQHMRHTAADRPIVLVYHRVTVLDHDHGNLAVAPDHFEQQIVALMEMRDVVPLDRLFTTRSNRPLAAITFDDGYRDVVTQGLPILQKYGCPATLFLATDYIGGTREFWWDELPRIFEQAPRMRAVTLRLSGSDQTWHLHPESSRAELGLAIEQIWPLVDALPSGLRRDEIARIADLFDCNLAMRPGYAILSAREVADLRGTQLAIGAHTCSHPKLTLIDPAERRREIHESRRRCEELTGEAPRAFAYPYGLHDPAAIRDVHDAGFGIAVTVQRMPVMPGIDPLAVPRIAVGNWDRAAFLRRIPVAQGRADHRGHRIPTVLPPQTPVHG